jgi:hypothetical protein
MQEVFYHRRQRLLAMHALDLGQPPLAFVHGVLFCASQSFLSPVSHQTNRWCSAPVGTDFWISPAMTCHLRSS